MNHIVMISTEVDKNKAKNGYFEQKMDSVATQFVVYLKR